ncbi:unnamed protein product, partial [Mesorhabditis spiculigera]
MLGRWRSALLGLATVALIVSAEESSPAPEASEAAEAVDKRAIDNGGNGVNADGKFQLYIGTIDGVRRMLFNEVDGGQSQVPTDVGGRGRDFDQFGAYDDNTIVDPNQEKGIFIPRPFRPKDEREEATTTTTTTTRAPTTRRTLPTRRPVTTRRPFRPLPPPTLPPAPVQPQQPFRPQPLPQTPLRPQQPQPPRNRRPPVGPPQTVNLRPAQPIQPFAPQQPQPAFRPQPTFQPQPQQPQQPFQPQPQFQRPPQQNFQQQNFQQPQPTFQQPRPNFQQPQQPTFQQPQPTFQQPPQPVRPPPTTPAPRPPFGGAADPSRSRTGVCGNSIFYISTPLSGPSRLSFTHFAIAVTVDQCARTCHEFNCAIAHYNPVNGHCEFNPSTAFAIRNGQCPAWPSLHYRNNVVASEAVRIFCVTCQRPRRRMSNVRGGGRFNLRQRSSDRTQRGRREENLVSSSSSLASSSRGIPVIHGVLVKPHTSSKASGLSTSSFVGLTSFEERQARARAAKNIEMDSIALDSLEGEMEEVEPALRGKARGTSN